MRAHWSNGVLTRAHSMAWNKLQRESISVQHDKDRWAGMQCEHINF